MNGTCTKILQNSYKLILYGRIVVFVSRISSLDWKIRVMLMQLSLIQPPIRSEGMFSFLSTFLIILVLSFAILIIMSYKMQDICYHDPFLLLMNFLSELRHQKYQVKPQSSLLFLPNCDTVIALKNYFLGLCQQNRCMSLERLIIIAKGF